MTKQNLTVLTRRVESRIFVIRGRKVILDTDLAEIYGVAVKRLNEQVKRNAERFPSDFVFRINAELLRSQFATSNKVKIGPDEVAVAIVPLSSPSTEPSWPRRF